KPPFQHARGKTSRGGAETQRASAAGFASDAAGAETAVSGARDRADARGCLWITERGLFSRFEACIYGGECASRVLIGAFFGANESCSFCRRGGGDEGAFAGDAGIERENGGGAQSIDETVREGVRGSISCGDIADAYADGECGALRAE